MDGPKKSFRWSPAGAPLVGGDGEAVDPARALEGGLEDLCLDRTTDATLLVRRATGVLADWLAARPATWSEREARRDLGDGLRAFRAAQDWRAVVAAWSSAVDQVLDLPRERAGLRALLAEELALWLGGADEPDHGLPWDGTALAPGRRLVEPEAAADAALQDVEPGEVLVVHGGSDALYHACLAAVRRGLAPDLTLTEGGPELHGRALALRLAQAGVKLRLVHDVAALEEVARADRVWVATESIGVQAFAAPLGTRALCQEAQRREVPAVLVTPADRVAPAGALGLPAWGPDATWLLWQDAPSGVTVEPRPWEAVPIGLVDHFATERGRLHASELFLAALRTGV